MQLRLPQQRAYLCPYTRGACGSLPAGWTGARKRQCTLPPARQVLAHAEPSGTVLPEDDEANIIRDTFMRSYEEAQPCQVRIPGMQDFAAAVWNRYRNIPSSRMAGSSLDRLFDEFDVDRDGHLTAAEIASALNSRGVLITEQEAAMFIKASDANSNHTVERFEWPGFIWSMAAADLSPDNLDPNLPRCATEPHIELEIEQGRQAPCLEEPSTPEALHSWFNLRTSWPDDLQRGPKMAAPDPSPPRPQRKDP